MIANIASNTEAMTVNIGGTSILNKSLKYWGLSVPVKLLAQWFRKRETKSLQLYYAILFRFGVMFKIEDVLEDEVVKHLIGYQDKRSVLKSLLKMQELEMFTNHSDGNDGLKALKNPDELFSVEGSTKTVTVLLKPEFLTTFTEYIVAVVIANLADALPADYCFSKDGRMRIEYSRYRPTNDGTVSNTYVMLALGLNSISSASRLKCRALTSIYHPIYLSNLLKPHQIKGLVYDQNMRLFKGGRK